MQFIQRLAAMVDPVPFCTKYVQRRGGIARLPIPGREVWMVSNPHLVEYMLTQDAQKFGKNGEVLSMVATDLGRNGLFTVDDMRLWKELRRLINPEFHLDRLPTAVEVTGRIWQQRMGEWKLQHPVRLHDEFVRLNLYYLMHHMFGQTVSHEKLVSLADRAQPVFQSMFLRILYGMIAPRKAANYTRARDALALDVERVIAGAQPGDANLLQRLKKAGLDNQTIRDQIFTLLMAGFDSTATVTSWAAIYIASNPSRIRLLRDEVRSVMGDNHTLRVEDLIRMENLRKLQDDVLRLHPAFPLYFRGAKEDWKFMLNGQHHAIRQGATIIINLDGLHGHYHQSIPFGKGHRMCPAEKLARATMLVPLAMMLQRFETWQNVGDHRAARYTMTRWPKNGAAMMLA